MIQYKCGSVIATDEKRHLAGIFTAGDLKRIINNDVQFSNTDNIDKYLNKKPIVIDIRETIGKAKELFRENNINQLAVIDDSVVVGLLELNEVNY
jgi:arabinose-5-phosphate isomerase